MGGQEACGGELIGQPVPSSTRAEERQTTGRSCIKLKVGVKSYGCGGGLAVCMVGLDPGSLHGQRTPPPWLATAEDRSVIGM